MHTVDKKVILLGCTLFLLFISCLVSTAAPVLRTVKYEAEIAPFGEIDEDIRVPDYDPFHLYLSFFLSPGTMTADLTGEIIFDQENGTITMQGRDGNFRTDGRIEFNGSIGMDFVIPGRFFEDFFGLSNIQILNLIFQIDDFHLEEKISLFTHKKTWRGNTDFNSLLLSGEPVQVRAGVPDILSAKLTVEDLAGVIVTSLTGIPPVAVTVAKAVIRKGLGSSGISLNAGLTSDLTLSCKALTANGKQITQEAQSIAAPGLDLSQSNYWVNSSYVGNLGRTLNMLFSADYEFMFNPLGILIWEYDEPFAELSINVVPQQHTDLFFNTSPDPILFPIVDQAPAAQPPESVRDPNSPHTVTLAEQGGTRSVDVAHYFSSLNTLRYRVTSQNTSIARTSPVDWQSESLFTIQPINAGSTTVVIIAEDLTSGSTATQTIAVTVEGTPPDYTDISQPITGIGEQPKEPLRRDTNVILILNKEARELNINKRNIRDNPGFNSNVVRQVDNHATGVITDGPVILGNYTWYEVKWDDLPRWNKPRWISAYWEGDGPQVLFHNPPDLEIYTFDANKSNVKPGEALTLEAVVKNNGPGDSEPTNIFFYYSTEHHDALTDLNNSLRQRKVKSADIGGDAFVDVPSIREGGRKTIEITVDAPLTPHMDYYYGAILPPEPIAVTETQALNNFTTKDLPNEVREKNIEVTSDPDFIIPSISANKSTVDPGEEFELEVTVKNRGLGTPIHDGTLNYYRSSNETIRDNDTKVGSDTISKLDTDESGDAWIELTAPTTPGVYYYGVCVDLGYERETGNNCSSAVAITVRDPAPWQGPDSPDLIVAPFNVSATILTPGEPFTLNATVRNQGNGRADATTLRYYRSSNTRISLSDTEVGSSDIRSLNAENSAPRSIRLTAPIASGTYYYGACVDSLPTENDTQNNCSNGVTITVENLAPVATDTSLPAPTLLANGTSVTIDMHPYFSDPNDDDISYQAWTDNTNIVAVHLFGGSKSLLTINPLDEAGVATVVVEAKDAQSLDWSARQDITVTVTAPSLIAGVCDRTPEIRDALTRISSVANCANITSVHLDALTTLVLASEGITALKVDDFDGLSNLTVLDLSENLLARLDTSALNPLVNLRQLDVSRNQLTFLDEATFNAHSELATLDLSDNQLAYIPPRVFGTLANLTKLNLAGNRLTQLSPGIFVGLNSLTELDVRDNPNVPFILSPTPVRTDTPDRAAIGPATIAIYVVEGAPFDIDVSLTAENGTLSETTVTIARGETHSQPITVTPTDTGVVTVVPSVSEVPLAYYGIQASPGNPLVLFDTGANQAPVAVADIPAQTLIAGSPTVKIDVSKYFSDRDDDTLTYTADSSNVAVATVSRSGSTVTIRPVAAGNAEITVVASDGTLTETQTIAVTVAAPAILSIPDPILAAAVQSALGLGADDPITQADMLKLTFLNVNSGGKISNITGLEHATNLTQLLLGLHQISDLTPLENLTKLTYLSLSSNKISDVSPLKNLTKLTSLSLGGNTISDVSPLKNLTKLTLLQLQENQISDVSPLKNLTSLTLLELDRNKISDVSPLKDLTSLTKYLSLWGNQISDVSALTNLTSLTGLSLGSNQISDVSALTALTNLTTLYLYRNKISDVSALAALTKLTELSLWGNQISDVSALTNLTSLTGLQLEENQINDVSALTNLTSLTYLSLASNQIASLPTGFFTGFSNLNNLILTGNSGAPFTLTLTLARTDTADLTAQSPATVKVKVAEGAPFAMSVSLSVKGGTPSATTGTIARGSAESSSITVTQTGNGATTVTLGTAPTVPSNYKGIQTAVGNPLVLFSAGAAPATVAVEQPNATALLPNYPNPFNPETWIPYQLATPTDVILTIYTMQGVLVRQLELGHRAAGFYRGRSRAAYWDGRNIYGEHVASGVYFYVFSAGNFKATGKMFLRK